MKNPRRLKTNLGAVLLRWRINEGITIRKAASFISVAPATWMRIEHGYGLDAVTLVKLLEWFMRPQFPPIRRPMP